MDFSLAAEEAPGFPKQHVPDLHPTGFFYGHTWVYVHSLGLQSQVKMQGLGRSLTSWIQSKVNPALKGLGH